MDSGIRERTDREGCLYQKVLVGQFIFEEDRLTRLHQVPERELDSSGVAAIHHGQIRHPALLQGTRGDREFMTSATPSFP